MRQADFVHLHLHSAYSLLQSTIRLPRLLEQARTYRLPALALTDHGNMCGSIEFYDLAYGHGIKPILGCELAIEESPGDEGDEGRGPSPAGHLVLLAKDWRGYQNLIQLVTLAHAQSWQSEPRISQDRLFEHRHGLIALSGCLQGEVPGWLLLNNEQKARERAAQFLEVFGRKSFFIEIQPPLSDSHRSVNDRLIDLARRLNLEVVATANCHTLHAEESELLKVLAAIRLGTTLEEIKPIAALSFLSPEEMKAEFAHLPEAIAATLTIAERCNLDLDLGKIHLPKFPLEKGQDAHTVLGEQAREGLRQRLANLREPAGHYLERLEHELKAIKRLGLADYFLVVSDFVRFAKARGVPVGPGSGAAGSSLIAYALGVTEINPIYHDLLFEHLVNPQRPEVPDMDLGFGMEMRDEVHQYLRRAYGEDRVAHIVSLGTMQTRTALRDLGRVLSIPQNELERTAARAEWNTWSRNQGEARASLGPGTTGGTLSAGKILALAGALEGLPRHVGTHATGLVIAAGPLVQRVPLYRGPQGEWVSQYDMHALKRVGLVKFDFLARKALTVMRRALELIGSHAQVSPGLVELPWDDKPAYDLLCRGRTAGIPHLETPAAREILLKWQPKHWHDLLVLMVLIRPTALESGLTERLLQARLHQEPEGPSIGDAEQKNDEDAQPLLFDVDLTRLIEQTTGSSMEQADLLRRQMVRRNVEEMDSLHEEFLAQAETNGCRRESAEARWAWLERAAPQVQNKSQTVGRALVVLQTAFLKARYPQQFMTALLNSELRQLDLLVDHVKACHAEGQTVLASDINLSGAEFTVESGGIRFGLAAVRQVSLAAAEAIVRARQERGPFRSLAELCAGVDQQVLGKRALEALIKAGALDSFRCPRKRLFEMLSEVFEQARRGQMGLFNRCDQEVLLLEKTQSTLEWDEATKLAHEKEALGFYLSGHPLSEFVYLLEKLAPGGTAQVSRLPDGSRGRVGGVIEEIKSISSRKNEPLHFLKLEDLEGTLAVVVFADTRVTPELGLEKGARVLVMGRVARADGRIRLVADEIVSLEEAAASKAVSVHLHLRVEGITPRELEKLRQIMSDYPGTCPISLHFYLGRFVEVVQRLSSAYTVRLDRQLEQRLREAFGERCLEVRYEEALSGGSATHEAEEGD